jgi:hypothetical protein
MNLFYAPQATETESEEEILCDFFVSGEDAVTYEDGLYYLSLYINDEYVGTSRRNSPILRNAQRHHLSSYLSSTLKTEANETTVRRESQYLSLGICRPVECHHGSIVRRLPST